MKRKIRLRDYIYFDFDAGLEGTVRVLGLMIVALIWVMHFVTKSINYRISELGLAETIGVPFNFVVPVILTVIAVVFIFVLPIVIGIIEYIGDLRKIRAERIKENLDKETIEHEKTITVREIFENSGKENI